MTVPEPVPEPLVRLTIDLGALTDNYRRCAAAARPGRCGAVVKANAYGLGAREVSRHLALVGCEHFFVATLQEGRALRDALPQARIYVFAGASTRDEATELAALRLVPVLNDARQLAWWAPHRELPIALHVDTGMSRLGFEAGALLACDLGAFQVALLVTHLANADVPALPANARQRQRFAELAARFPGVERSIASSAAVLSAGCAADELARAGIALFGGNPFSDRPNPMRPVAHLEARVLQLREVRPDTAVGYGSTWIAPTQRLIGVVGAGYADGVPRLASNRGEASFRGRRVPIVGRVSMDLTTVDASAVAGDLEVGDHVQFFGDTIGVDEVAAWAETIAYEVLTGVGSRVARRYVSSMDERQSSIAE